MRIRLAHHKGRERQGNKEIIWNHTGWMLLLLLLMWENDRVCCIIHSSSNITEMFSRRPDYTKSWLVDNFLVWPSLHSSSNQPFPTTILSIFPLFLQTSVLPSILPSLHFFISLLFTLSFTFSTQALRNLPIPCFHRSILALFQSFHLTPGTGRMQQSLGPIKNVTSDRLDKTLYRSVDLSFQCAAVTLLTSLISLLTAHEHGQETGAGRVLLSITSPAGADQQ